MNFIKIITNRYPNIDIHLIIDDNFVLQQERNDGFIEYKRTVEECGPIKIQKYATQMQWRLSENTKNYAIYYIGVDDDGSIVGIDDENLILCIDNIILITQQIDVNIIKCIVICVGIKKILKIIVKNNKKISDYINF